MTAGARTAGAGTAGADTADRELLAQTAEEIFAAHGGTAAREAAEASGWAGPLWDVLERSGLTRLGVPEEAGGSGGDAADALTLLQVAGRHAAALPLAESSLLGGWLLAAAGIAIPAGPLSVPVPHPGDELRVTGGPGGRAVTGLLHRVPWGSRAAAVAALADGPDGAPLVVALDPARAAVTPARNLAGDARDLLRYDRVTLPDQFAAQAPAGAAELLSLRGALSRAALLAGAAGAAAAISVRYARERRQFGQPIARFQAVAGRLVQLNSEAELAGLAVTVAGLRFARLGAGAAFEVAAAKASAARAAAAAGPHAHQVHGAIGMTREYELQHVTRRLLAWRDEWGGEARWNADLGERVLAGGADALWPQIATGLTERPVSGGGLGGGLGALLRPRSIAIIGASENPLTISGLPLQVLRQHEFSGELYLVNPNRAQISGLPCYPDVASLPGPVDLALVAVRAELVPGVVAACAAAGTRAAVIFSSGFGEQDAAGRAAQARLASIARDTGIRLLGPNGEGFFNVADGVPASFSPTVDRSRGLTRLAAGGLAVVSQSGGLGFALFNWGQAAGLGASFVVTTGNECDVDALEVVDFLADDPQTTVIALLAEGFTGGPSALLPVARRVRAAGKHLVMAKLGRSPAGRRSAPTHSAHDAGDPAEYDRVMAQAGVVAAADFEDLLDACFALAAGRPMTGRRVGILTASGGAGIWAADACELQGLEVPELSAATQQRLRALMPPYGVAANPVDLTAQGIWGGNVVPAVQILCDSGEVDAVLVIVTLAGPDVLRREGTELGAAAAAAGLPVLIYSYTAPGTASIEILQELRIPWYASPHRAARALRVLSEADAFAAASHGPL